MHIGILQELRKHTQAEKIFSMNKKMIKHKILLSSFLSKNFISRYSVVFQSVGYKQDTANQGNIQRNAVNMSNETGESTEKADLKEENT